MGDYVEDLLNWMEAVPVLWAYATILVIAYGENVLPPIPGDMVVVFGGYLVGVGKLSFVLVVLLSTVGGALGFMTMYAIGRKIGEAVIESDRVPWIPRKQVVRAREWLERWGYGLVAANRFLSGLRSVISLAVGMANTPVMPTAFFATLSALVWTGLITYGGFAVGDNWEAITDFLRDYGRIVMAVILFIVGVQVARWYLKRKGSKTRTEDSGNFNSDRG